MNWVSLVLNQPTLKHISELRTYFTPWPGSEKSQVLENYWRQKIPLENGLLASLREPLKMSFLRGEFLSSSLEMISLQHYVFLFFLYFFIFFIFKYYKPTTSYLKFLRPDVCRILNFSVFRIQHIHWIIWVNPSRVWGNTP